MRRKFPDPPSAPDPNLLNPAATAAQLKISVSQLHMLRRRREIPAVAVGPRNWRFPLEAIKAYAATKSSTASAVPQPQARNIQDVLAAMSAGDYDALVRMANAVIATGIEHRISISSRNHAVLSYAAASKGVWNR